MTHCAKVLAASLILLLKLIIVLRHSKLTLSDQFTLSAQFLLPTISNLDVCWFDKFFVSLLAGVMRW